MTRSDSRNLPQTEADDRVARLEAENAELHRVNRAVFDYIRAKTNQLLNVIGTKSLRPEELEDWTLLDLDPIGIVSQSFRQILENLRETNERLQLAHQEVQAVFEAVGSAVLVLDPQMRIVAYNKRAQELLLNSDSDPTGVFCQELVCRSQDAVRNCVHRKVLASGRPEVTTNFAVNDRIFDVIGQPIRDPLGRVSHVVLAYNDVTEHQRDQAKLKSALDDVQRAKRQIDTLLRTMSDGLIATDGKRRIVLVNEAAEALLGLTLRDAETPPLLDVICHHGLREHLERVVRGEEATVCDLEFADADGRTRIIQARTSAPVGAATADQGRITLLHDVTRAREIERIKDEFLSTAAHQLRTPLASVIGFADLLIHSDDIGVDTRLEYLSLIHAKAEQLSEIVGNLLDISRIEAGEGVSLTLRPCSVNEICTEALAGIAPGHDGHQFDFAPATPDVQVLADRFGLLQVLENLLSNAVKYSPQGGLIRIGVRVEDDGCVISVSDQGIGMTEAQAAQAFDKFYRADASNTAIGGTGLGLTIVRHLILAHGGKVWIDSRPGAGTTIHCRLQLAGAA